MNWSDLKLIIESQGVKDTDEVVQIDFQDEHRITLEQDVVVWFRVGEEGREIKILN